MTLPPRLVTMVAVALVGLTPFGLTATARAYDEPTLTIAPNLTDPAIVDTNPTRGSNLVWLGPPERRVGKLLVFLPTGGPTNLPTEFREFGTEASRLGYHTIILAYRNEAPIAAAPPAGCGNSADPADSPPNCAINIRLELLNGEDKSSLVVVNKANGIENRLNKLLAYLVATRPASEGWAKFWDTSGPEPAPKWSETVIAGSSLGAGEAAIIASQHAVYRAVLMHGWTDAQHGWVTHVATPSSRYFTLIHARDAFFARTCYAYVKLGLAETCPLPGFTIPPATVDPTNPRFIENRQPPYGTPVHVFNIEPGSFAGTGDWYHQSTSRDGWIAREPDGTPSKKLLSAWRSVLGDSDGDARLDFFDSTTAGGTVAATLALTLGTPASFGAFTPGLAKDYLATATANVISTAGDAALSVTDSSATAPGHLVNGTFSLPQALQARAGTAAYAPVGSTPSVLLTYPAPISNDAVTLGFKQPIGATDALRTGAYSKTLTFTLSTTTP